MLLILALIGLQLATLPEHPESVPINALVAVAGTPLEGSPPVEALELVCKRQTRFTERVPICSSELSKRSTSDLLLALACSS